MAPSSWPQVSIVFDDWNTAEAAAAAHLAPVLAEAEATRLVTSWSFIRKQPCWRVRYQRSDDSPRAPTFIHQRLDTLQEAGHIRRWAQGIYEPETHAFGGPDGMDTAHRLFHADSRHILTYLIGGITPPTAAGKRRELAILLCGILLRAARLDWFEQGDTWAAVSSVRELPDDAPAGKLHAMEAGLRRLMTVDGMSQMRGGKPLAFAAAWAGAFATAGSELADLAADGILRRGVRAVLAHHIIFAWNRMGLPYATQAVLANAAQAVVFGCEHTTGDHRESPP